ncbi:MAG: hydrogenase maturation protease [Acidobacteriota bacterium]|nr:hydrogenase maturation protease [Acidobacteriota bacterium]MDH3528352.1 hydrogenase maturation protease [Acidobacteriota bacterium]
MRAIVIGVGNEYRGDDAAGLIVARTLKSKNLSSLKIIEASGEGASLLEAWKDSDLVIVLDASCSGARAGTVFRFDANKQKIPAAFFRYSTHAFSVAEAVELARSLEQLPPNLIVYSIEGKNFAAGAGISPEVANVVEGVIERALCDLEDIA